MSSEQTTHISVTIYSGNDRGIYTYAISEDKLRQAELRLNSRDDRNGRVLKEWLEMHGCPLDSDYEPAVSWYREDGSRLEEYYSNGKLHRVGGPAYVESNLFGDVVVEEYYRDGRRVSRKPPVPLSAIPGVAIEQSAAEQLKTQGATAQALLAEAARLRARAVADAGAFYTRASTEQANTQDAIERPAPKAPAPGAPGPA
jgi:hypothetical protein